MGSKVAEVAKLFLRLGFTAFGGPAAHVALIEDEVVHRRKWIDRQHFMDLLAAVNFIPGPNSTELAIHLGLIRAGFGGLLAAGVCFITPAVLIILPLGYLYVRFGQLPNVAGPFAGIRAAMIAIIASAMVRFGKASLRDGFGIVMAVMTAGLSFLAQIPRVRGHVPQPDLILLGAAAVAGAIFYRGRKAAGGEEVVPVQSKAKGPKSTLALPLLALPGSSKLLALSLFFLKIGATLFGSGYVLVSYLHSGLVDRAGPLHLSARQLTDAIAVGQVTPGPLLTTSTFVGYILGYRWGGHGMAVMAAVVATLSIFAPSFFFVAILGSMWGRIRRNRYARGALDGMNAAVVALIFVAAVSLGRQSLVSIPTILIAGASLFILLKWRINATWLIASAGLIGLLIR